MANSSRKKAELKVPSPHDWRTSDTDEINKRKLRARDESFQIHNLDSSHPIFSNFRVQSGSGLSYSVEIRDIRQRQFACDCVDFRINGLGTCKHVEAVLLFLEKRFARLLRSAVAAGSDRIDLALDSASDSLLLRGDVESLPPKIRKCFDREGHLQDAAPEEVVSEWRRLAQNGQPALRISQELQPWIENRSRTAEGKQLRHAYELNVQSGEWPPQETKVPLFPYQRDGMLHLAFTERALLADEMGLGKTIQAIAACALLYRLGKAQRVLVVTPASLKTEWEEQIQRFTDLPYRLVFGPRHQRLDAYKTPPFFTIANYEQIVRDALDVNALLRPDIVVLDEAQRIKNWSTKTAQSIKRLHSRYAFVLTGTPIENRIDELHSLMDFLNPAVLGPLFRFNRDFYELDDRGRPKAYRNLNQLHDRVRPYLLRRRKADVETELPERTDRNHFVTLTGRQRGEYADHEAQVARLMQTSLRRPLTVQEQEKLQRELAMMRMTCDTTYILNPKDRDCDCPKITELEKILEECCENDTKAIVFSEWEKMLELVRAACQRLGIAFAWHTGSVPQLRRRAEINLFKNDPNCRVFLSTDSGATGLNLQSASIVINCDLPWNPAKLEQRIARAWRKHQTRPVTVINLVAENTLEHRMLGTLAAKQALSEGVLDLKGDLTNIPLRTGGQAFLKRLQLLLEPPPSQTPPPPLASAETKPQRFPADRSLGFAQRVNETINGALIRCEERYPESGAHSVLLVVVDKNPAQFTGPLTTLHQEWFGPGKSDPLSPIQLEVIDRATDEALQRLAAAGLIQSTTRASRPLYPPPEQTLPVQPLSADERARIDLHRSATLRRLKMARVLANGGLPEEARLPLLEATHLLGRALAVQNRLPEPNQIEDALLPPLSHLWLDSLSLMRSFVADVSHPIEPVVTSLTTHAAQT